MSGSITPPAARQMDNYDDAVKKAFEEAEKKFFSSGKGFKKDEVISLLSPYGFFKIDYYENSSPTDVHFVVFFYNKKTKEVAETHGTIARFYIEKNRNKTGINDFVIINDRAAKANNQNVLSIGSNYTLLWESATNNVKLQEYKTYNPIAENKLIAFTEEFSIESAALNFKNWKNYLSDATYKAYENSRTIRARGIPTQILLHETAGKNSLTINGVRKEGNIFFIPHFCVNNTNEKGNIIQFADVAEQTFHGEVLNDGAVGIEFVNAPFEAYEQEDFTDSDGITKKRIKKDGSGKPIPIFKLHEAKDGIYVKTNIPGFGLLFIPLAFTAEQVADYFEISLPLDKVVNAAALEKLEWGADKKKIALKDGEKLNIKYAKPDKFEHLLTLVSLLSKDIVPLDVKNLNTWKTILTKEGKQYFLFSKAYTSQQKRRSPNDEKLIEEMTFGIDIRQKGIYCHGIIGHHADGYLQALYLFLRMYKTLDAEAAFKKLFQLLLNGNITKQKVKAEVKVFDGTVSEITGNTEIELANCLEIT